MVLVSSLLPLAASRLLFLLYFSILPNSLLLRDLTFSPLHCCYEPPGHSFSLFNDHGKVHYANSNRLQYFGLHNLWSSVIFSISPPHHPPSMVTILICISSNCFICDVTNSTISLSDVNFLTSNYLLIYFYYKIFGHIKTSRKWLSLHSSCKSSVAAIFVCVQCAALGP